MEKNIYNCIESDCVYFKTCKRNPEECDILRNIRSKRNNYYGSRTPGSFDEHMS